MTVVIPDWLRGLRRDIYWPAVWVTVIGLVFGLAFEWWLLSVSN